tara:strand:+ start:368 stop:748 length:381 start_codon:yes stop_codon:yes gene_type:complete
MNKIKNLSFVFIIIYLFPTNIFSSDNLNTKIYKNLRCLVCQGQSIADSNSEFALTLKSVVNDKVNEGLTEQDIYKFLAEKYGDWILYNPPLKSKSYLLWALPYAFFIFGGLVLFFLLKKTLKHRRY